MAAMDDWRTFGLFLGAGFSRWAAGLPVANGLFDFDIEPSGPRDAGRLNTVRTLKYEWDKTHPKRLSEEFIADALTFNEKSREALIWYIARRLSAPFIWNEFHSGRWRRHVLMIDENRRFSILGVTKAADFIKRFSYRELDGIITTNYDMLVEYALGTKGVELWLSQSSPVGPRSVSGFTMAAPCDPDRQTPPREDTRQLFLGRTRLLY